MKKITYILALLFTGIISAQTIGKGSNTLTGAGSYNSTTYQTLSDLNAVSPIPAEGTPAKVANDPSTSNNGYYSVVSGSWVKDAELYDSYVDFTNTATGLNGKAVSLYELPDIFENKLVVDSEAEYNTLSALVDFWVDDPSAVSGLEFRVRALYIDDATFSDRFGIKEITEDVNIWSHVSSNYGTITWGDDGYQIITIPYEGTTLYFVWDDSKVFNLGTDDTFLHKLKLNSEPKTAIGQNLYNQLNVDNKVLAALGDSITMGFSSSYPSLPATCGDHDNQDWNTLQNELGLKRVINCGIGGATWQDRGDENITDCPLRGTTTGTASNCIRMLDRLITAGNPTPDIITFAFGTNNPAGDGDFDTVMGMTFAALEADEAYRQTMYGALRYNLETITTDYPDAQIVLITPVQSADRSYTSLKDASDAIKVMGERYNCHVVDMFNESGIIDLYEVSGGSGMYLSDGVHLNSAGKELYTKFLSKKLKEILNK